MSEEQKKDIDFKVINFGAVAQVPIIEENLIINTRTPWVYYGPANLAPQELIRLYNTSPTHRACITSKWYAARGKSITIKDGDNSRLEMVNSLGDNMYDIWNKCMLDFILYGSFSCNLVWRKDRDMGFEIYYIDTSKLRAEKSDMHDHINNFYYSSDWAFYKKHPFVPRKLPAFNPSHEEPSQIFYYSTHSAGNSYYGTPSYWGGATAISTQVEIFNWHHSNIVNGLSPSLFISLNSGVPGPEEREQIYQQLNAKYGGSNQSGKLFLTFSDSKDNAPEITPINPNSSDKMWVELNQMVQETILTSHQISSPELLGIQVPGALGSSDHLEAQDHFMHLVIAPIQTEVSTVFSKLLSLRDGGIPTEIEIEQFEMVSLPDMKPIETVDVNKEEGLDINKDETINRQ
jgi:hypothetical protein